VIDALEDRETVLFLFELYFRSTEYSFPTFLPQLFRHRNPSSLLIATILLFGPRCENQVTFRPLLAKEGVRATLAKSELTALLDHRTRTIAVQDIVAVLNLALWAHFGGQLKLASQLLQLSITMWNRSGFKFAAKNVPLFKSRDEWLEYWERWRLQEVLCRLPWINVLYLRDLVNPAILDMDQLDFPANPCNRVWKAMLEVEFLLPPLSTPPTLLDGVRFLQFPSTSLLRQLHATKFTTMVMQYDKIVNWTLLILRNRVDLFLADCLRAGVASPALLPLEDNIWLYPQIRALLRQREELDATLLQTRAAFPDPVDAALRSSDASALLNVLEASFGFQIAFSMCMFFPSIPMLRLELYTGLGVYMTPGSDMLGDAQYLADPFSAGGPPYTELLAEAASYTRLLEGWISKNPTLEGHASAHSPLVFRTTCLHAALKRRLDRASETMEGGMHEIRASIDRDCRICLVVLGAYAAKFSFLVPQYRLACKIADAGDGCITGAELEVATGYREDYYEAGEMMRTGKEFGKLLGAYRPVTVRPGVLPKSP
jgi:hypothetical protein